MWEMTIFQAIYFLGFYPFQSLYPAEGKQCGNPPWTALKEHYNEFSQMCISNFSPLTPPPIIILFIVPLVFWNVWCQRLVCAWVTWWALFSQKWAGGGKFPLSLNNVKKEWDGLRAPLSGLLVEGISEGEAGAWFMMAWVREVSSWG